MGQGQLGPKKKVSIANKKSDGCIPAKRKQSRTGGDERKNYPKLKLIIAKAFANDLRKNIMVKEKKS